MGWEHRAVADREQVLPAWWERGSERFRVQVSGSGPDRSFGGALVWAGLRVAGEVWRPRGLIMESLEDHPGNRIERCEDVGSVARPKLRRK